MNLLKTMFYDEFACIGAECPLTCCGGWMIAMEEKTLKDYRMMGGEIGRFARKGVTYNSDLQSYIVRLRDTDGMCPMLNEDQLCEIVLNKGNKKLCRTCATFPRETVRSYDTDEKYIFLGCPKAAHLLFEVSGKITFMFERDPDLDMEDIPIIQSCDEDQSYSEGGNHRFYSEVRTSIVVPGILWGLYDRKNEFTDS